MSFVTPRLKFHEIFFDKFHTSYIFKVNQLAISALDAVYKKILPTFFAVFSRFYVISDFFIKTHGELTCRLCIKTSAVTSAKWPIYEC